MKSIKILLPSILSLLYASKRNSLIFCFAIISIVACKKDKKEIEIAINTGADNGQAETEMNALFLCGNDFASIYKTNDSAKVIPAATKIIVLDSNFNTNDGIHFIIDFGLLGAKSPFGMLCLDGRYRAGKIYGILSKPFMEIGSVLTLMALDSNQYRSGNGKDMYHIISTKSITRTADNQWEVKINDANIIDNAKKVILWSCNRVITKTKDAGIGVQGDVFSITGSGSGTAKSGEKFTVNIIKELIKNMSIGCASTFIDGVIEIKNIDKNATILLDFNPYNDAACDRVAKATIGKREKIFYIL